MTFVGFISFLITAVLVGVCWSEHSTNSTDSSGYELLLAKMDYLEYKFLELQVEVKEQGESLAYNQEQNKKILEQTSKLLVLLSEKTCASTPEQNVTEKSITGINSCKSYHAKTSGRYWLTVSNTMFEVYCEMSAYGSGWTVIQNRFNGWVNFFRGWDEYKNGFGNLDGEFWLGLEKIYLLTSSKPHELLVHLEAFNGTVKFAKYTQFAIGKESEKYALQILGTYSGTAGDSLTYHKGQKFSTHDADNDNYSSGNCANEWKGAWWYNTCSYSNLNGIHKDAAGHTAICWYAFFNNNYQGLKVSKMMIREV